MSSSNFLDLVEKILTRLNYTVTSKTNTELDFIASQNHRELGVDAKYYRTSQVYTDLTRAAQDNLASKLSENNIHAGILITSCYLNKKPKNPIIEIWDRSTLLEKTIAYPDLYDSLVSLLEITPEELTLFSSKVSVDAENEVLSLESSILVRDSYDLEIDEKISESYIQRLKEIPLGKNGAKDYENLGCAIFKYLFEKDLLGWREQLNTADGLNRYDYVCRIKETNSLWQFLIQNLNSRYIVIEFKNYAQEIGQEQVLTTEKYLLDKALRKFAIISSRKGKSENAQKMAQGAMRESGKLIVILEDDDLVQMLQMKDSGSDPADYLFNLIDDFLLTLPR
ncbi:hypothetical protein [Metapseudomonas otitidis]|uniref:hypothetical protein n=1 Tax=Metapseudomonas otitidis TaxID=319939 RepID=UPI0013E01D6E|nr:hypothetical protein [Pseudomonas otitidis]